MRPAALLVIVVVGLASPAAADAWQDTFAGVSGIDPKTVRETQAFELAVGGAYTHVVVGRYEMGDKEWERGYLLRCDRSQCVGHSLFLGGGTLELLGVVDLEGPAVPFPTEPRRPRRDETMKLGERRMKHPVLIVRATDEQVMSSIDRAQRPVTGTRRTQELALVSLQRATHPAKKLLDETVLVRGVSGAGYVRTIELVRAGKGPLELVVTTRRMVDRALACLPPPPTTTRYRLGKDLRYHEDLGAPGRAGC